MEASALEVTLVINVTSNVVENPLCYMRVGKERKAILERQSVSNKQHCLSIPALYLHIGGLHLRNLNPVVHVASIGRPIPQMVITVLKNGLGEDGREGNSRDHGGGGGRHRGRKNVGGESGS